MTQMQSKQKIESTNLPPARRFVNRREMSEITGISIPALAAMATQKRGPVCRIPEGFSENKYELSNVLAWMRGEAVPAWPDPKKCPPYRSKRGANMARSSAPGRNKITKPGTRKPAKEEGGK